VRDGRMIRWSSIFDDVIVWLREKKADREAMPFVADREREGVGESKDVPPVNPVLLGDTADDKESIICGRETVDEADLDGLRTRNK